jgi:hypothetical protein
MEKILTHLSYVFKFFLCCHNEPDVVDFNLHTIQSYLPILLTGVLNNN